jgi:RHS repeat-associated protein
MNKGFKRKLTNYLLLTVMLLYIFSVQSLFAAQAYKSFFHSNSARTSMAATANEYTLDQQDKGYRDFNQDTNAGLYYLHARYYDPKTRQFLTKDPAGMKNLYGYCVKDPINATDPIGLFPVQGLIALGTKFMELLGWVKTKFMDFAGRFGRDTESYNQKTMEDRRQKWAQKKPVVTKTHLSCDEIHEYSAIMIKQWPQLNLDNVNNRESELYFINYDKAYEKNQLLDKYIEIKNRIDKIDKKITHCIKCFNDLPKKIKPDGFDDSMKTQIRDANTKVHKVENPEADDCKSLIRQLEELDKHTKDKFNEIYKIEHKLYAMKELSILHIEKKEFFEGRVTI